MSRANTPSRGTGFSLSERALSSAVQHLARLATDTYPGATVTDVCEQDGGLPLVEYTFMTISNSKE